MELVCPAGNLPALKAAVDNGANAVYIGFRDDTNARHFAGLNFAPNKMVDGIRYARSKGVRVFIALNTYPRPDGFDRFEQAVDRAAELGVDALIAADLGVLDYASRTHPRLSLHLSVQGSATNYEALRFYHEHFGIRRAVLPRVLSISQVQHVIDQSPVEIEVFAFGSLCVMVEGRCILSSYATGRSPNTFGACSPASHVEWIETEDKLDTRLGGVLIQRHPKGENVGYPTLCKGTFNTDGQTYHAIEDAVSLNAMELLPQMAAAGVKAVKIEGRQRSPVYVAQVTKIWREALDSFAKNPGGFTPKPEWTSALGRVSEGAQTTLGPYHRPWQ
ncbi:ubiquinone anaerobic biosynthesis protein UbiU [Halochromatium glycolicum]|uniref:Ubiquinone biosynthesis protein UbiU n=1 Tax=Halochromatium glycolicum TaxID=85075 RepID=A0AAJ0U6M1_9GAMM|nr:peptidase U32 family protein [Halochromatium glycolicum]MBK1706138.1 protease [Halochromatium glycolicum]